MPDCVTSNYFETTHSSQYLDDIQHNKVFIYRSIHDSPLVGCWSDRDFFASARTYCKKNKSKYNTEYPNLPAFHSPLYNMRASSMLRKEHPNEKEKKKINTCFVLK